MRLIRNILDSAQQLVKKDKRLVKLKPLVNAVDEFFFGTDKITSLPHIVDHIDIKRYMTFVIIGLLPATLAAVYFWGLRVLVMIALSYACGGMVEVLFAIVRKKEVHEGFLVTGLIFPLILPPTTPLWMVAAGVMFGVVFGKEVFGGTGRNIFNPAIVGRIFLSIAFPSTLTTNWVVPFNEGLGGWLKFAPDAIAQATPLAAFRNSGEIAAYPVLLSGGTPGCIGEVFRIGLIIGGIFLIICRISDWRLPLAALSVVVLFSGIGHNIAPQKFAPPLFQLLSGGLLLGAFFMLTDPVTSPFTRAGRWIGGAMFGFLVVLIRGLSGYVEGVMFSVLLLNVFSPLIDHMVLAVKYPCLARADKKDKG